MIKLMLKLVLTFLYLTQISQSVFAQPLSEYRNYAPVFSPDGKQIAFSGYRNGNWDIYIINSDGSNLTRVTNSDFYEGEPSWSPDGSWLAFVSDYDGDFEIYTMKLDGTEITQLTYNTLSDDDPAWSPSGNKIHFRTKTDKVNYIYEINPDGTGIKKLSVLPIIGRVRHSKDGSVLTFVTDQNGLKGIHKMNADGTPIATYYTGHDWPGNPHLSPNGNKILFDAHAEGTAESGDGKWELWIMDLSSRSIQRLTFNNDDDWGAYWSSDGKKITFCGNGRNNTGYEIFIMNSDGSNRKQLSFKTLQ